MRGVSASEIWDDLLPRIETLLASRLTARTSGGASGVDLSSHSLSGALHTGVLADSQGPQFLLRGGGRSLTGDWAVDDGVKIDGVDISAHVGNANAHHNQAHVLATALALGPDHSISGATSGHVLRASGATTALFARLNHTDLEPTSITSDQHHAQLHAILDTAHHSYSGGAAYDLFGLSAPSTLARLSPSYDVSGGASAVLRSNAGALGLDTLTTAQILAPVNLRLSPTIDLLLSPGGDVLLGDGLTFRTETFSTAYPIEGAVLTETDVAGQYALTVGVISADELRTRVFVADEVRIERGKETWGKSYGITVSDFTTPAAIGGTVSITFESSAMIPGALFSLNDFVVFRTIDIDTGVVLSEAWGQMTAYTLTNVVPYWEGILPNDYIPDLYFPTIDLGTTTQDWEFTLRHGDTNQRIAAGNLGLDYGQSGQSYISFDVTDPVSAPNMRIRRWTGSTPWAPASNDDTVYIGNLGGVALADGDRGIWVQNEAGTSWVEMSDAGNRLRNASIELWNGGDQTVNIGATGLDFWMGTSPADKRFVWDGDTLSVEGEFVITGGSGYSALSDKPTTLGDINAGERYDLQSAASVVFMEAFNSSAALDEWTNEVTGKGELSIVNLTDTVAGGNVLRVGNNSGDDQCWLFGTHKIPFDAGKTYRMRVRVRRVSGTATLYLGCAGVAANGVDWVNRNGSNTIATQHYHTAGAATPGATWTEYVGYIRGFGATVGSGAVGTPSSPGQMHPNVRYIVPIILVNGAVAGQYEFDMVSIEAVTGVWYSIDGMPARFGDTPGAAGLYLSSTEMGYWNGTAWKTWIASTGEFYFGGATGAHLEWNGEKLRGLGVDGTTTQWYADSTDGKLYAGAGAIKLDVDGIRLNALSGKYSAASLDWYESTTRRMSIGTEVDLGAIVATYIDCSGYPLVIDATEMRVKGDIDLSYAVAQLKLSSMTTTQRNALTPINGSLIYNTTDAKFQGYQAGSWVNLA